MAIAAEEFTSSAESEEPEDTIELIPAPKNTKPAAAAVFTVQSAIVLIFLRWESDTPSPISTDAGRGVLSAPS
jgi:hypothetical protein